MLLPSSGSLHFKPLSTLTPSYNSYTVKRTHHTQRVAAKYKEREQEDSVDSEYTCMYVLSVCGWSLSS